MNNKKRKIAILSGKRGGFGAMLGLMKFIDQDPEMDLQLIVTDMHLSEYFGYTAREVEKFFNISYKLDLRQQDDSGEEKGRALGRCIIKMANILTEIKPDILVTLGDRGEVLSGCIAAMELNIPTAHIGGGDIAGNRDGNRIHAITKLAHLHFPFSADSGRRITKLGEESWRVFSVGSPYADFIVQKKYTPNDQAKKKYNIKIDEKYIICIQHPMTLQESKSYKEACELLNVLVEKKIKTIITYPCSDQGYKGTVRAIEEFSYIPFFQIYKNIEALDFWGLMAGASLFIGNSSSGLMETPYFSLPTINIGLRQNGRIRDNNVIDVEPQKEKILGTIDKALSLEFKRQIKNSYIFGNGHAGEKIYKILKEVQIDDKLLMKKITY